jgi:ankyrin repeat protein
MMIYRFIALFLVFTSCTTFSQENYFDDRWNLGFDEIFNGTEISLLKKPIMDLDFDLLEKVILENNIDINSRGVNSITLLHWVVGANNTEMTNKLLSLGADSNAICFDVVSVLSLAIGSGNIVILESLIDYG